MVHRLLGGKGGFGALLRGAGRAALTDNFDACRDLSGRRLRHVNADKKLADWAAEAKERQLEKLAMKHLRNQERERNKADKAQACLHLLLLQGMPMAVRGCKTDWGKMHAFAHVVKLSNAFRIKSCAYLLSCC